MSLQLEIRRRHLQSSGVPLGGRARVATGVAARLPPSLELAASRTQATGHQPEELPERHP
eukprot:9209515-Pyramimonas_sp.AAC.1